VKRDLVPTLVLGDGCNILLGFNNTDNIDSVRELDGLISLTAYAPHE